MKNPGRSLGLRGLRDVPSGHTVCFCKQKLESTAHTSRSRSLSDRAARNKVGTVSTRYIEAGEVPPLPSRAMETTASTIILEGTGPQLQVGHVLSLLPAVIPVLSTSGCPRDSHAALSY